MASPNAVPLVIFLLVMARVTAALVASPILGEHEIPAQVKVGLAGFIAFLLTPAALQQADATPTDPIALGLLFGQQILLGLAFALIFIVVYRSVESAGQIIGQQIGVTLGSFVEPGQGELQTIGALYRLIAGSLFLGLDGHHWIILGLGASFAAIPVTRPALTPGFVNALLPLGGAMIEYALGLALPLLAVLLLADIITGLLGRAIPSLNMFVLGLPIKVVLAFAGLLIGAPFLVTVFLNIAQQLPHLALWK